MKNSNANETQEQKAAIKVDTLEGNSGISLNFKHGKSLELLLGDLTPEIITEATLHGLKQKLVDSAAISRDPTTGQAASIETKYEAVLEVLERLKNEGLWNKVREGGEGNQGGILLQALMSLYGERKTKEELKTFLDGLSKQEKNAIKIDSKVAKAIRMIEASRVDSEINAKDLLGELD